MRFGDIQLLVFIHIVDCNYIPSISFFQSSSLLQHPGLGPKEPGSVLFNKYSKDLELSLNSILNMKDTSAFHLDALVFSLENTKLMMNILKMETAETNAVNGDSAISFEEYEKLIGIASDLGIPKIHGSQYVSANLETQHGEFRDNYDIIYVDNIFDELTLRKLHSEIKRLWASSDIEGNCNLDGYNRMGGYVHHTPSDNVLEQTNSLYSLIYGNEALRLWMSAVTGVSLFPADFPIELREYGSKSKGMPCHADTQMYADASKDFEVVVTLSNHGKCQVYWYDRSNIRRAVWPAPNSITIVRANAAVHCVSETKGGSREILKFIMVGDHLKNRHFFEYTENQCSINNPNIKLIEERRAKHGGAIKFELDGEL